jgi:hypothetical protein
VKITGLSKIYHVRPPASVNVASTQRCHFDGPVHLTRERLIEREERTAAQDRHRDVFGRIRENVQVF